MVEYRIVVPVVMGSSPIIRPQGKLMAELPPLKVLWVTCTELRPFFRLEVFKNICKYLNQTFRHEKCDRKNIFHSIK